RAAALAYRTHGHAGRAARALRAALAALPAEGARIERCWNGIEHGNLLIRAGRWDEARRIWRDASADPSEVDFVGTAILAVQAARAELRLDEMASAERRLHQVEAWLAGHPAAYVEAHVHQLRAELDLARGEIEAGTRWAERAL